MVAIAAVILLATVGAGTALELHDHLTLVHKARTVGTVTGQVDNPDDSAVITYRVRGKSYTGFVLDGGEHSRYLRGSHVTVIYDVNKPSRMRTPGDVSDDGAVFVIVLGGLSFLLLVWRMRFMLRSTRQVRRLIKANAPWWQVDATPAGGDVVFVDDWLPMRVVSTRGLFVRRTVRLRPHSKLWVSGDRTMGIAYLPKLSQPTLLIAPTARFVRRRRRKVAPPDFPSSS